MPSRGSYDINPATTATTVDASNRSKPRLMILSVVVVGIFAASFVIWDAVSTRHRLQDLEKRVSELSNNNNDESYTKQSQSISEGLSKTTEVIINLTTTVPAMFDTNMEKMVLTNTTGTPTTTSLSSTTMSTKVTSTETHTGTTATTTNSATTKTATTKTTTTMTTTTRTATTTTVTTITTTTTATTTARIIRHIPGKGSLSIGHLWNPITDEISNAFVDIERYDEHRTTIAYNHDTGKMEEYDLCDPCEHKQLGTSESSGAFSRYETLWSYFNTESAARGYSSSFDIGGTMVALASFMSSGAGATAAQALFGGNQIGTGKSNGQHSEDMEFDYSRNVVYEYVESHQVSQKSLKIDKIEAYLLPYAQHHIKDLPDSFDSQTNATFRRLFVKYPPFIVWREQVGGQLRSTATVGVDSSFESIYSASQKQSASSSGLLFWKSSSESSESQELSLIKQRFRDEAVFYKSIIGGQRTDFINVDNWSKEEYEAWVSTVEKDPQPIGFQVIPITRFISDIKTRDATAKAMLDFYGSRVSLTPQEHEALRFAMQGIEEGAKAQQQIVEVNERLAKVAEKAEALQATTGTLKLQIQTSSEDVDALGSQIGTVRSESKDAVSTMQDRINTVQTLMSKLKINRQSCTYYPVNMGCWEGNFLLCADRWTVSECPDDRPFMAGLKSKKVVHCKKGPCGGSDEVTGTEFQMQCCKMPIS